MVYYKLVLNDKRPKSDEIYPIEVRITHNRKNTSVSTGIRVFRDHWDEVAQMVRRTNPNFQPLNQTLSAFYLTVQKSIHRLQNENRFSFEALKADLAGVPEKRKPVTDFVMFAGRLINEMFETV